MDKECDIDDILSYRSMAEQQLQVCFVLWLYQVSSWCWRKLVCIIVLNLLICLFDIVHILVWFDLFKILKEKFIYMCFWLKGVNIIITFWLLLCDIFHLIICLNSFFFPLVLFDVCLNCTYCFGCWLLSLCF